MKKYSRRNGSTTKSLKKMYRAGTMRKSMGKSMGKTMGKSMKSAMKKTMDKYDSAMDKYDKTMDKYSNQIDVLAFANPDETKILAGPNTTITDVSFLTAHKQLLK